MRSATTLPNALSFRYPRSKHLKLPLPIQLLPEGVRCPVLDAHLLKLYRRITNSEQQSSRGVVRPQQILLVGLGGALSTFP